jgi:hypothetical protein
LNGTCSTHVGGGGGLEISTKYINLKRRFHFGNLIIEGRIIFKLVLHKSCVRILIGLNWLRI